MKIVNSVSAGYSSVMMAIKMREWYPKAEIINIMANTSIEREESLIFMDQCDKYYDLNLVWVEADIIQQRNVGTSFIVKEFETLTRDGSIFESGIIKYGIPSRVNKWCNRELKLAPIHSYLKSINWGNFGKDYYTAIGIRIDEIDRISVNKEIYKILYPLIEKNISQKERNKFWSNQEINISIPAYLGNCKFCQEKSLRKLMTEYTLDPSSMEWNIEMQKKYSSIPKDTSQSYNSFIEKDGGHYSLRDNKPWQHVIEMSSKKFKKATDEYIYENDLFDLGGSCNQGCNIYSSLDNVS